MIDVAKENSKSEKALQAVETIMEEHGIKIWIGIGGLYVDVKGVRFSLMEVNSKEQVVSLPRSLDSERMVLLK